MSRNRKKILLTQKMNQNNLKGVLNKKSDTSIIEIKKKVTKMVKEEKKVPKNLQEEKEIPKNLQEEKEVPTTIPRKEIIQMELIEQIGIKIDKNIYFGNIEFAKDGDLLKELKIKKIVNCSGTKTGFMERKNYQHFGLSYIEYFHATIGDSSYANAAQYFDGVLEFITKNVDENNRVLIHCNKGQSRSATFACLYLMNTYNWSLQDCIDKFNSCGWETNINDNFKNQLEEYFQAKKKMNQI